MICNATACAKRAFNLKLLAQALSKSSDFLICAECKSQGLASSKSATMPGLLMRRAVVPQSSRTAACFERIIFADENRCNHQQGFLGDLALRKFTPDCS